MAERFRVLMLFGPPGSGKGTQGKILGHIPGLVHLATGDMFRGLEPGSELANRVAAYSSKGELVPDELTVELWEDHVAKQIDSGAYRPVNDLLVLDGIPRSVAQADVLDRHVEALGVVRLHVPTIEPMVERMKQRTLKEGRQDDADEGVIRRRFEVYDQETAPVLDHYPKSLVHGVAAIGTPIEVLQRVLEAITPICARHFGNPLG